jgi:hypothetical protein
MLEQAYGELAVVDRLGLQPLAAFDGVAKRAPRSSTSVPGTVARAGYKPDKSAGCSSSSSSTSGGRSWSVKCRDPGVGKQWLGCVMYGCGTMQMSYPLP